MNNEIQALRTQTKEEIIKQQELDAKTFKEVDTDEKFNRIIRSITNNNQNNDYLKRRVNELEREIRRLKDHEHGNNGSVVVKLKDINNFGGGSELCGISSCKNLLA